MKGSVEKGDKCHLHYFEESTSKVKGYIPRMRILPVCARAYSN